MRHALKFLLHALVWAGLMVGAVALGIYAGDDIPGAKLKSCAERHTGC